MEKLLDFIEDQPDWSVNRDLTDLELEYDDGYNQHFIALNECYEPSEFIYNLSKYWAGFDVSQETYYWLDKTGHGKNGAPYEMKDIIRDFERFHEAIYDLIKNVENYLENQSRGNKYPHQRTYKVLIEETICQEFEVFADCLDDATDIAERRYKDGEFVIDNGEVTSRQISAEDAETHEWVDWREF